MCGINRKPHSSKPTKQRMSEAKIIRRQVQEGVTLGRSVQRATRSSYFSETLQSDGTRIITEHVSYCLPATVATRAKDGVTIGDAVMTALHRVQELEGIEESKRWSIRDAFYMIPAKGDMPMMKHMDNLNLVKS